MPTVRLRKSLAPTPICVFSWSCPEPSRRNIGKRGAAEEVVLLQSYVFSPFDPFGPCACISAHGRFLTQILRRRETALPVALKWREPGRFCSPATQSWEPETPSRNASARLGSGIRPLRCLVAVGERRR